MRKYWGHSQTMRHLWAALVSSIATAWEPSLSVCALGSEITLQTRLGECHSQGFGSLYWFIILKCAVWIFLGMGRACWLIMFICLARVRGQSMGAQQFRVWQGRDKSCLWIKSGVLSSSPHLAPNLLYGLWQTAQHFWVSVSPVDLQGPFQLWLPTHSCVTGLRSVPPLVSSVITGWVYICPPSS